MFCPKCSQQQSSEEVRFCSRCGFQLALVKAALAADGSQATSPLAPAPPTGAPAPSKRQRDKTVGAFLMFLVALLVVVGTLDAPPDDEAPVLILICWAFVLIFLLNVRPLWRYFFGKEDSAASTPAPKGRRGIFRRGARAQEQQQQQALPPAYGVPVTNVGVRPPSNTAEVVRPPSVTEGTTNLLDKK